MRGGVLPRAAGRQLFGADASGYHAARLGYSPALIDRVEFELYRTDRLLTAIEMRVL